MKKLIVLSLGLILIAAACNKSTTDNTDTDQTNNQTTPPATPTPTPTTPTPSPTPSAATSATINITSSGFSPSSVTVKKGAVVTFKNTDSKLHQPASDPHPSHLDLPGFDALKGLANNASYSFTFNKVGTWGFHDHLNSSLRGSVTVVE